MERVSATDVSAGYDIRSFEDDGNIRHIEVKSSTNSHILFYWSSSERCFAQEHRLSYWIYFVPRVLELPRLKHEITLIKDPIAAEGKWLKTKPYTYEVCLTANIRLFPRKAYGTVWTRIVG